MPENNVREPFCRLTMLLSSRSSYEVSSAPDGGVRRSLTLSGFIDDADSEAWSVAASALHKKPASIEIYSPPGTGDVEGIAKDTGVKSAPGVVGISASGKPEEFELRGEKILGSVARARLGLEPASFADIRQLVSHAEILSRKLLLNVELLGSSLPPMPDGLPPLLGMKPADLDLSRFNVYAFRDFKIFMTRFADRHNERIGAIYPNEKDSTSRLDVLLTTFRYDVDVSAPLTHSLRCEGHVLKRLGQPLENVQCDVTFQEHDKTRQYEWPERAPYGRFGYYPASEQVSSPFVSFDLMYMPEDVRELLLPLFTLPADYQVIIGVSLAASTGDFTGATAMVSGDVLQYRITVFKKPS